MFIEQQPTMSIENLKFQTLIRIFNTRAEDSNDHC